MTKDTIFDQNKPHIHKNKGECLKIMMHVFIIVKRATEVLHFELNGT